MPDAPPPAGAGETGLAFAVFTEIGIVNQLVTALLETRLPAGMVAAQFGVLVHLSRRPEGQTPVQIARAFQVPKTSMTHSLAVLAGMDLVETAPNPADGRSKIARITPAGRACLERTLDRLAPDMATALKGLEPGTLATLLAPLGRLRAALDAARDG
jgi:DNA-binding MarR family transcriptional regulator